MTPAIELAGVSRLFGTLRALDDVSLSIAPGEFFALLGPSGSGKTTCLRLIAGFDRPTRGKVLLDGEDVTDVPPYERSVNTVFQDYALFPHMSVVENVAYGPRVRGVTPSERRRLALEVLELVRLGGLSDRAPSRLSGGQKQRAAISRAVIRDPKILILADALSSVDTYTEEQILTRLQSVLQGRTSILISHRISTVRGADQIISPLLTSASSTRPGSPMKLTGPAGTGMASVNQADISRLRNVSEYTACRQL